MRLTDAGSLRALSRQVQDNFEESVAMSTYLVAMVVCDYTRLQDKTANGVAVSIYAPQHLISQAQFALNVSTRLLEFYQNFFGVLYPLPKQGELEPASDLGP